MVKLQAEMKSMLGDRENKSKEALSSRITAVEEKIKELHDEMEETTRKHLKNVFGFF